MKKTLLLITACILTVVSICHAQERTLVIDGLEMAVIGGPDGTVDFGAGNGSSVEVASASDNVAGGKLAIKVTYNAVNGGYMYIARGAGLDAKNAGWDISPDKIDWQKYRAIAFHMYGTDSKSQIAFDVKDSGGEIWRYTVADDFKGWKQVICPFDKFMPRSDWQPEIADKNSAMDFPLKSYQFEPLPESKGTLYFDMISLIEK